MTSRFLEALRPLIRLMPDIEPPARRPPLSRRLLITLVVLILFFVMSHVPLYGLRPARGAEDPLYAMRIIFAASYRTLTELGIGPIVTAGLVMQLLAYSEMIEVDMNDPRDRALFTGATKVLTIVFAMFEASAYLYSGIIGQTLEPVQSAIIFAELVIASFIIMLLDELLQKGWGIGSGVSLFILAGVAQQILWSCFAPIAIEGGRPLGAILYFFSVLTSGGALRDAFLRENYPDMLGFTVTIALLIAIVYLESVRIEFPITHVQYRGYSTRFPIKLLYVSNIPVILAAAVAANVYFFTSLAYSRFGSSPIMDLFGKFRAGEGGRPEPVGGLVYYMIAPRGWSNVLQDPVRSVVYALIFTGLCVVFSITWVEVGGMSARDVAEQIVSSGLQIPGFRRAELPLIRLFSRYIWAVTILGGILVALISITGDFLGVFGGGIGILLSVDIAYNYYTLLIQERIAEAYPRIARVLGVE
ncbi:preprotein translocase subunit SecY [archaeon]|nr:preprotein translocase subunit SecY [archaeon]